MIDAAEIIDRMSHVDGWFDPEQAMLMITCADEVISVHPDLAVVELGSFRGRSTVVLASVAREYGAHVTAIDPHQGDLGVDGRLDAPGGIDGKSGGATFDEFITNIKAAGVAKHITAIRSEAHLVDWSELISVLFVDSQHDYASVRRDFEHFEPHIAPDGIVLFHDYREHPLWGVIQFVTELEADGWQRHGLADGLIGLRRKTDVC